MNSPCTIVYASDTRGMLPLSAALWSLAEHAAPGTQYDIYLLSDGIPPTQQEQLRQLLHRRSDRHTLHVVDVTDKLPEDLVLGEQWVFKDGERVRPQTARQWPRVAWSRIFLPDLLPHVHRALYLDIDTLICDDLQSLFSLNMQGAAVGVVLEHESHPNSHFNERLDIPQKCPGYFNSGVLLMDLDVFRRDQLTPCIMNYARSHAAMLTSPDQDALNGALCNRLYRLHPRWNWHDGLTRLILKANPKARLWRGHTPQQSLEAALRPGILHYQGRHKPWKYNHRLERQRYEQTLLRAGLITHLPLPGWNFPDFLKHLFYAPLYALTWKRIQRLAQQFGISPQRS